MPKFFSGLAMLILALVVQFWLASVGIHFTMVLAVLIAFAFIFDFWELLFYILFSVFLLNWQPVPSASLAVFALIPLAAFGFRKLVPWQMWLASLAAIFLGFFIFYLALAPTIFLGNLWQFLADVAVGLLAGELVLFALN